MKFSTRLPKPSALALAAAAAVMACGTASAQTQFTGFTSGCFGAACTPAGAYSPTSTTFDASGLTYANSTFNVMSSAGFAGLGATGFTSPASNVNNLGSWSLTQQTFNYTGTPFTLLVSFSAPPGTTPGVARDRRD